MPLKKPWVRLPPSLHQNVLSFNLDDHILHCVGLQASSILFSHILPSPHPSPLFLSLLHWFSITLGNSPSPCACLQQARCIMEDGTALKRAVALNMPCLSLGHEERRSAGRWDVKIRRLIFPAATAPRSLISRHLPFYLLHCSQPPCPHLSLLPIRSVPRERTKKTRRSVCFLVYHLQKVDCWFTPRALQSVRSNSPCCDAIYHTIHKVLWKG